MAAKIYQVVTAVPGYYTSRNAILGKDRRNTVQPAKYYIYNEANGAINVTSVEGVPGSWINPDDNIYPHDVVTADNETEVSAVSDRTTSTLTYDNSTTPALTSSSGSNKKVYKPNKDEIPCYIINTLTGQAIKFECEPEEFSDSNSAQFDAQEVRGRSSPYQGYNNSGPRELSFTLTLHDDLCEDGILATVNKLRSLVYPSYEGILIPPSCEIRLGDMVHCNAIVTSVSVTWQKPFRNGVYVSASVDISATEVVNIAHSCNDIWSKGGYI